MRTQAVRKGRIWPRRSFHIWAFFGVVLAALVCSAVVGTQSVRASYICTSQDCSVAQAYSEGQCFTHTGLVYFACPANDNEQDDFLFLCGDSYYQVRDCLNPGDPS